MFGLLLLIIVVVVVFFGIGSYNKLISLKNQVQNAWKQIDVQLKRRHDLIPNLINTVKGAMGFEREWAGKIAGLMPRRLFFYYLTTALPV